MKVKRFIASDMRAAIQLVREDLGAEAVILSNRMLDDGVEILASNDYSNHQTPATDTRTEKKNYRTYADVPEPAPSFMDMPQSFDDLIKDEAVSLSSQAKPTPAGMAKAAAITSKLKQKVSAGIFDRRQNPADKFEEFDYTAPAPASGRSEQTMASNTTAQRPEKIDYSQFIVDEKVNKSDDKESAALHEAQLRARAENDSMKAELKALRSLLETQMNLMNWEKHKHQNPVQAGLLKRFTELGLTVDVSQQILAKTSHIENVEQASKQAISILVNAIPLASDDILQRSGIVALVGPTGVGKTTTIAKLAARHVMSHGTGDIALVTLDNYRVGAQEQLFNYAKILGVPVHSARHSEELYKVLQNLYDKKLILIDTAGMSQKDMRICEQFNTLKQGASEVRSYLVLSANAQTSALDEVVRAFKQTTIDGCILTKLDEAASLGGAISMLIRHQLPLTYISNGQCVPEDLQTAHAKELVSQALTLLKQHPEYTDDQSLAVAFNDGLLNAH